MKSLCEELKLGWIYNIISDIISNITSDNTNNDNTNKDNNEMRNNNGSKNI